MTRMGQRLFFPPNVKGWDGGAAWLNSGTLLTRENFAAGACAMPQTMQAAAWLAPQSSDVKKTAASIADHVLQGDASPAARAQLEGYLSGANMDEMEERIRGAVYLAMATPAYQLS